MPKANFPSFSVIAKDAWHRLTDRLLAVIGVNVVSLLLMGVVFLVGVIATLSAVSMSLDFEALRNDPVGNSFTQQLSNSIGSNWQPAALGLGLTIVAAAIINLISGIATLYLLGSEKKPSVSEAISLSFSKLLPVIVLSILGSLLVLGSLFLFFIPGIIVSLLIMFSVYELVLANNSVVGSMRRSIKLISSNFGSVLGYLILYFVAYALVMHFIPNIIFKVDQETGLLLGVIRAFLNFLVAWYGQSFSIMLYKAAQKTTPNNQTGNLMPIVALAILGYVTMAAMGLLVGSAFSKLGLWDKMRSSLSDTGNQQAIEYSRLPSSCGISVPVPKTTQQIGDTEYAWYYDEAAFPASSFPIDSNASARNHTVAGIITFRPFKADPGTTLDLANYPAIIISCIENPKQLTLAELVSVAENSRTRKVEQVGNGKFGELLTTTVETSHPDGKEKGFERGHLAVSHDGHRLIYISVWGDPKQQLDETLLQRDFNTITNNLENRPVAAELARPQ